jgi:hypothetical protein
LLSQETSGQVGEVGVKFLGLVLLTIVAGLIVGALLATAWTRMQGLSALDQPAVTWAIGEGRIHGGASG